MNFNAQFLALSALAAQRQVERFSRLPYDKPLLQSALQRLNMV